MEYGLMVEPQVGAYQDLRDIALAAEEAGYVSIARSDHYLNMESSAPATDALTSLGGLARETDSIKLTVLVTPLTFRHPGVIAKTAATLDEMSGGRFELGVGTGWMEGEHRVFGINLPDLRTRFSLLFETLAYIHSAFGRTDGGYSGRHFSLEDIEILPRPITRSSWVAIPPRSRSRLPLPCSSARTRRNTAISSAQQRPGAAKSQLSSKPHTGSGGSSTAHMSKRRNK